MPHFKAFGMLNLQHEIRICQILYNKGTITNTSWYPFKCNRCYLSSSAFNLVQLLTFKQFKVHLGCKVYKRVGDWLRGVHTANI